MKIAKLEAAHCQLEMAIELFAKEADPIAVHTLAAAAYQILADIAEKKGGIETLFNTEVIRQDRRKDWIEILKRPSNFFKHADRDPEGDIEFEPRSTEAFIMFAIGAVEELGLQRTLMHRAFLDWYVICRSKFVGGDSETTLAKRFGKERLEAMRATPRPLFFEAALTAYKSKGSKQ